MATKTQIMNEKNERAKEKAYHKALLIASEGELPPDRAVAIAIDCGWDAARASSPAVPSDELLDRTRECLRKAGLSEYMVLAWTPDVAEFAQQELDRQASDAVEKERERVADLIVEKTAAVMDIVQMRHSINDVLSDLHTRRHGLQEKS